MELICQSELCQKPMEFVLRTPELVNSKFMSALVFPVMGLACPSCGQLHRVTIASAQIANVEVAVSRVDKRMPLERSGLVLPPNI